MTESRQDIQDAVLRVLKHGDWIEGLNVHKEVEYCFQHAITYQAVYDALGKLESDGKIEWEDRDGGLQRNWLAFRVYRLTNGSTSA